MLKFKRADRTEKVCTFCRQLLPLTSFFKGRKSSPDGYGYTCKTCEAERKLEKKYGLSKKDNEILYEKQEGKCAICSKFFLRQNLVVDHNHTTGKTRGLLCNSCNRGIGLLQDSEEVLFAAQKYLMKHNNPDPETIKQ